MYRKSPSSERFAFVLFQNVLSFLPRFLWCGCQTSRREFFSYRYLLPDKRNRGQTAQLQKVLAVPFVLYLKFDVLFQMYFNTIFCLQSSIDNAVYQPLKRISLCSCIDSTTHKTVANRCF